MTTPTSIPTRNEPPLQNFIGEMCKLQSNSTHTDLADLQPYFEAALDSLVELRKSAEHLPDLSHGSWFLRSQYLSARDETSEQLRIVRNNMLILAVMAQQKGDRYGIMAFIAGFLEFFDEATKSPVIFQQPFTLRFPLQVPDPIPDHPEEVSLESLIADDFSDPV